MITKQVINESFDFGELAAQVVPVASTGVDWGYQRKVASSGLFANELASLRPMPGYTILHIIALGDEEVFGCHPAGTGVLRPDGTTTPIEQMQLGDDVVTASGNIRSVTTTYRREVDELVTIRVEGQDAPIVSSAEHPYLVARKDTFVCKRDKYIKCRPGTAGTQNMCKRGNGCDLSDRDFTDIPVEFVKASTVEPGDYFIFDLPNDKPPRAICEKEARLIGYWLAEGSFTYYYPKLNGKRQHHLKWRSGFSLSFGYHEEHTFGADAAELAQSLGWTVYTRLCAIKSTFTVIIRPPREVVNDWYNWFGSGAANKRLPTWTVNLPTREQIVYGYICGDGTVVDSDKESRITAHSISRNLLRGIQKLCWSLGFSGVICESKTATVTRATGLTAGSVLQRAFHLSYAAETATPLLRFNCSRRAGTKVRNFIVGRRVFIAVREVKVQMQTATVYNLEVEGDHTYVSETVASHNCNRNCDGFSRADCQANHHTFVDLGHVFKNHKHFDPSLATGKVLFSGHNTPASRTELVVALDNSKNEDEVQAVNSGKPLAFSMGSAQKYDVCSLCQHKAPTADAHCFGPETLVLLPNGAVKRIADVKVGDRVVDASGHPVEVIHCFKNTPTAPVYKIRTSLAGIATVVTGNHPLHTVPAEHGSCLFTLARGTTHATCWRGTRPECATCRLPPLSFDYAPVEDVRVGDYLRSPVIKLPAADPCDVDLDTAWLIGLFAAEGCYSKVKGVRSGVQFSLNKDETDYVARIEKIIRQRFNKPTKVYPAGPNGISVRVHNQQVAEFLFSHTGEYAHHKQFSETVMAWPDAHIKAVLDGLFDGDGHVYSPRRPGRRCRSKLNTASPHFAFQVRQLCLRLGYESAVGVLSVPGGPTARSNKFTQYYVTSCLYTPDAAPASSLRRQLLGDSLIGTLSSKELSDYTGPVYNIETTSGSYVADGIAVHNCDHVKYHLGQVTANGIKIYMKNPNPKFFDISTVYKPADRIAYTLRKVASAGPVIGGHELAAQIGLRSYASPKTATALKMAEIYKRTPAVGKLAPLPLSPPTKQSLKTAAALHGTDQLLRFLHDNGFLLGDKDFVEIIVGKQGDESVCQSAGLDDVIADDTDMHALDGAQYQIERINLDNSVLHELHERCLMTNDAPIKRCVRATVMNGPFEVVKSASASSPLGLVYKYYKLAFAVRHPELASMVAKTF